MAQSLETFLAQTQFPEAALKPVTERVDSYVEMVKKSNGLVAQIQASKANDPTNTEFLDKLWAQHVSEDEEMAAVEEKYQALIAESEKLLVQLRDFAKKHVPEQLSPEDEKAARKTVNDMSPTISEARTGLEAMLTMPESVLKSLNVELPEGGLISLLPKPDSLKGSSKGGRKSGESTVSYMTRVGDVLVDGESTQKNGKGKIGYAAEKLSERFNFKAIPQNKVTPEEIEEAYFASLPNSPEVRSIKSTDLPDEHTFTFTKEIAVQNGNDDSFKKEPHTVSLTVRSVNFGEAKTESKPEGEKVDEPKPESEKAEAPKAETETAKAETLKPGDFIKPEPAKTNEAAAKKTTPAPKK